MWQLVINGVVQDKEVSIDDIDTTNDNIDFIWID